MKKNCEFCKHAVPHYNPCGISYVCDLFNEGVGFYTMSYEANPECETTWYKCEQCKQAEVKSLNITDELVKEIRAQ